MVPRFGALIGQGQGHKVKIGIDGKGLSQGIHMWNMKAVPITVQKLWPRLKFLWQRDGGTDGRTDEWDLMSPTFYFVKRGTKKKLGHSEWGIWKTILRI